jgi:hypothetical protein
VARALLEAQNAKRGYSGEASSKRRLIQSVTEQHPAGNSDVVRLELSCSDSKRKLRRVASSIPWATDSEEQESPSEQDGRDE